MARDRDIEDRIATIRALQESQRGVEDRSKRRHSADESDALFGLETGQVADHVVHGAIKNGRGRDEHTFPVFGPIGAMAPAHAARAVRQPGRSPQGAPALPSPPPSRKSPIRPEDLEAAPKPAPVRGSPCVVQEFDDDETPATTHLVGKDSKAEPTEPGPSEPASAVGALARTASPVTEQTAIVRRRRIHPDAIDPETGEVLPTDHVETAPGTAGLASHPTEITQVISRVD